MNIRNIPLSAIDPNPAQPRTAFSGLDALTASIQTDGLLEPIMVRPMGERWEIVHGKRRSRAAQMAGLTEIPAIVRDLTDDEAFTLALVENMQRQNLEPLDEAAAYATLIKQGKTQAEIGALIGKGQSYVAQKLRLLRLPEPLTHFLGADALTENHMRQVLRLRDLYPPGLRATAGPDATWLSLLDGLTGEARASIQWEMLNAARPEELPVSFIFEPEPSSIILDACDALSEYVAKHTEGMPQWEMAAFWWLSLAANHGLSVVRLANHIDRWSERYESAICWWYVLRETPKPEVAYGWSVYGDLKHSASLSLDIREDIHQRGYVERLWEKWRARGFLISPSEMQRGAS